MIQVRFHIDKKKEAKFTTRIFLYIFTGPTNKALIRVVLERKTSLKVIDQILQRTLIISKTNIILYQCH